MSMAFGGDDDDYVPISPISIRDHDLEVPMEVIANPNCPNPDCGGDGDLRDGPWGNHVACPQCVSYSKHVNDIYTALYQANLEYGEVSEEKKADLKSLACVRARNAVLTEWEKSEKERQLRELDLNAIREEIKDLKGQLSSLQPEQREAVFGRLLMAVGSLSLAAKQTSKHWYGRLITKIKSPYVRFKKWLRPYVLRASYRMKVERSGIRHGYYEVIVQYEPSSFGKLMKAETVRQGYRRIEGAWNPYPYGGNWGNDKSPVAPSMSNFLEKRFVSDRLHQLMNIVDEAGKLRMN